MGGLADSEGFMTASKSFVFRFDDVEVREREFSLTKAGKVLSIEPKVFRTLLFLLHNPQKLITKDELLHAIWGHTAVTEGSLTRCIWLLRNVLGDDIRSPRYIETVPTVGYRFVAPVEEQVESSESAISPVAPGESEPPGTAVPGQSTKAFSRRWIWISATVLLLILIAGVAESVFLHRSPAPRIHSVTVLPLQNLSSEPNTEYFADGMTEGLSSELSAIPGLQVVSDSSVTQVKDSPESLTETARKLGVDAVIQGSVLRSKDKVSIDVRLFDARLNRQLWAARFEDAPANVSALQKHIASEIGSHAGVLLTPSQQATLTTAKPLDPSAYDGYLQGRYLLSKRDSEGAVKMFRRAVVIDPGYARSWAGLAAGLAELAMWTDPVQGLILEAKAAARHAIELDPENGEAWSVLGQIAFNQDRDWKTAEYDLQRAIALSPSDSTTESRYAIFLSIVGRRDEAVSHMRRALELDPLSFFNVRLMGSVFYWSRRYDESLEYIRKAEEMEPELVQVTVDWEVDDYEKKGMGEQAVMADLRNFSLPDGKRRHDRMDAAYRSGGQKAYWETRIKFLRALPDSPCSAAGIARIYVLAGENDKALENLNRALNEGCFWLSIMKTEPIFDPLRGDPRFKDMLKEVNLSE
jgi:TolB-like protein/DNA-binding winged helix-turn-helix (wHTH) protein/cytochrome c-type biogenesis protein CcmH/NrfG